MIIVIRLLIDNAIVAVDQVVVEVNAGDSPMEALRKTVAKFVEPARFCRPIEASRDRSD
ncbi:hypothetical protein Poly59_09810 [Rubripirellula reticaptiva]|uniref:Uncharacterized protein n=1 Tax=Rubripirellula reticaptiva TaxID=2528013 RepID=A0A5C6FBB8_9BACT|nr:hypothetical protein Poly59_09810 [Rubripirellula reticaptiva]